MLPKHRLTFISTIYPSFAPIILEGIARRAQWNDHKYVPYIVQYAIDM